MGWTCESSLLRLLGLLVAVADLIFLRQVNAWPNRPSNSSQGLVWDGRESGYSRFLPSKLESMLIYFVLHQLPLLSTVSGLASDIFVVFV